LIDLRLVAGDSFHDDYPLVRRLRQVWQSCIDKVRNGGEFVPHLVEPDIVG